MKRILLPTDFSENAYNAISYAVQLFKNNECEFYLLNTYSPAAIGVGNVAYNYSAIKLQKIEKESSKRLLSETKDKIEQQFNNTKHKFILIASFNLLVPEMTNLVEEKKIDLVIMGTKGATGAKEVFIGTHTMYAIKKMKCPVIAVPSGFSYERPKEILFPTDYKIKKSNRYLELIKTICEENKSRLHILNAYYNTPLEEEQKRVKVFLDAFFIDNAHLFHVTEGEELINAIETFETKHKINFLIMVHNKHNFFENLLFKPVINQMVYHTNVPFLVIPSEERLTT